MLENPQIIQTAEQFTAVIHLTIPRAEIQNVMGAAITEVISSITAQGLVPIGSCFSYHLKIPSDIFDFEVGFPVSKPILPTGRVTASKLPSVRVARTIYHGGYEGLGDAWGEFISWIENEGYHATTCLWESYATGPEFSPDPAKWITELNRPLLP